MFSYRVEKTLASLAETVLILCDEFANEADLYISPSSFLLITSNSSFGLVAALDIRNLDDPFTDTSTVHYDHKSRVSLTSFHTALLDGESYSSLNILVPEFIPRLTLRFENPTSGVEPLWLHRPLTLSPTQETLRPLQSGKLFLMDALDFRSILIDAPRSRNDSICVITLTKSQVKFSIQGRDITFTQEGGDCEIIGYEEEEGETQFHIPLHPKSFFLGLVTEQAETVWFQRTIDNAYNVISILNINSAHKHVIYVSQV